MALINFNAACKLPRPEAPSNLRAAAFSIGLIAQQMGADPIKTLEDSVYASADTGITECPICGVRTEDPNHYCFGTT